MSFSAANSIRFELSSIQIDVGMSLLDTALDPAGAAQRGPNNMLLGVASLGGPAAFKLLRMLSGKFRKACAANSFTGDTLVSTEIGLRPISEIKNGDLVWAYNEETGENSLQEVIHLIRGDGEKELVDITLVSGQVITATAGHPMYSVTRGNWLNADDLYQGDLLLSLNEKAVGVSSVRKYLRTTDVYNLTIANDHTYFVGADVVLGHNCRPFLRSDVASKLREGAQERHILNHPARKKLRNDSGSYFDSMDDARDVLDAVQDGRAIILGKMKSGNILVHFKHGKGKNHNPRAGYENQQTSRYEIKGVGTASVVPVSPERVPFQRYND